RAREDPEINMNVSQMIQYHGYPVENYDVITKDGYIISIQRIPFGQNGKCKDVPNKPVIFVQHGLLCSSTNWVANLPNESLAFILADNCFDVWLGNVRGNIYGMRHVNVSIHSDAFWDFSWDEFSKYDLTAMIDKALKVSNVSSLYYAGHSQGTMMMFAESSCNKDLASKIKAHFALGPVTTIGHIESPIKYLANFVPEVEDLFKIFGIHDFLPNNEIMRILAVLFCEPLGIRDVCSDVIFILDGFDQSQLNMTRLPVYISHTPAGTSVKNMIHYAQMYKSKKFEMYDYGKDNIKRYGQNTPPQYNISAITVPTMLYWGGNDWLADPDDVSLLMKALPPKTLIDNKELKAWQHLDFIWGLDAAELVYDDIVTRIKKMEGIYY
ncbi:predicted protein, partial [Nematostella vectensis]